MRRLLAAVAAAVTIVGLLGACDGAPSAGTPVASRPPTRLTDHSAQEAVSPDPNFDHGFTIHITSIGFRPHWLVATCCDAVVFKNFSNETVTVVFDHRDVSSGPIPPGGTWQFKPAHPESITYHMGTSNTSVSGLLQIQQAFEDKESPKPTG